MQVICQILFYILKIQILSINFLEPKGKAFVESDSQKEQVLEKINPQNIEFLDENDKTKIYGLKFYVEDNGREDTHGLFKEMKKKDYLKIV